MPRRHPVIVRPARAADHPAVSAVFLACWRTSYSGVLPARARELYDRGSAEALWARRFDPAVDPGLMVADLDGRVLGLAVVELEPDAGYLASLYTHPDAQGSGVGSALFAEAVRRTVAGGRNRLRWWVFSTNAGAIGFYLSRGGAPTGRTRTEPGYGVEETEMACPCGDPDR